MRQVSPGRNTTPGGSTVCAVLKTLGYHVVPDVVDVEACARIRHDLRRSLGTSPAAVGPDAAARVIAILQDSAAAIGVLDNERLGAAVDAAIGDDVILSRVEGVCGAMLSWQHDFIPVRRVVSSRAFRPGLSAWVALQPGALEVRAGSQHLEPEAVTPSYLPATVLSVKPGGVVLVEGGVRYRSTIAGDWLLLRFVRPWLKPDILYSSALKPDRRALLGPRGWRWCGMEIGLPTSVEEFLEIEDRALSGATGRSKGSGI